MKLNKKGVAFNWIFILIAGAAILMISTTFIVQYKEFTTERVRVDTLRNIDIALGGLKNSEGTFLKELEFNKKIDMEFGCEFIRLNGKTFGWDHVVFGSQKLEGKNFLLGHKTVVGEDVFYFVDPSDLPIYTDQRGEEIKAPLNKFVKSSNGIVIDDVNINFEDGPISYIGEEDLVGGIIEGDSKQFSCLQERIFEGAIESIQVSKAKAELLQVKLPECNYNLVIDSLNTLQEAAVNQDVAGFKSEEVLLDNKQRLLGRCPHVR